MSGILGVKNKVDHENSPVIIPQTHWRIHKGDMFHTSYRAVGVANNASADVLIKVGSISSHIVFESFSEGMYYFDIYEDTVISSDGTPIPSFNKKRASSNVSQSTFFSSPAITSLGTLIHQNSHGSSGGGPNSSPGESLDSREWVFKTNTNYLLRLTNKKGGVADMVISSNYYEPS